MKHQTFHNPDPFRIGKAACAQIQADTARQAMHRCALMALNFNDDLGPALDMARDASLASLHRFAAMEREALAVIRGAR